MQKIIVAIDGYAATGKSSQAKRLSKALGYTYIDTGAMYRAVTFFALQNKAMGMLNPKMLINSLSQIKIEFKHTKEEQLIFLNNKEVTDAIRKSEVTSHVSNVAKIPEVRSFLVAQQKEFGSGKGIVMDGRDIGSFVFPEAECKFFLIASSEIRAKRRHLEQLQNGINESYGKVLENIITRDKLDSSRETSPLKKAIDAIEIDVSYLSIDEVFQRLWFHISKKL
tara:strand:+ start:62 stop:733 length:672 start_codon:yes stop_codon:yes gene_type:complete